jgi:hypothetical protein
MLERRLDRHQVVFVVMVEEGLEHQKIAAG